MPETASWELQHSLYQTLVADAELTSLLGGEKIYDFTPERTRPPYITIGMTLEQDWSTSTEEGREHLVTLHSWASNNGRKTVAEISSKIQQIITNASLTMSNHKLINLVFEFNEIRRDVRGEVMHATTRYRIKTEPIE